jgi:hypothetical protein
MKKLLPKQNPCCRFLLETLHTCNMISENSIVHQGLIVRLTMTHTIQDYVCLALSTLSRKVAKVELWFTDECSLKECMFLPCLNALVAITTFNLYFSVEPMENRST